MKSPQNIQWTSMKTPVESKIFQIPIEFQIPEKTIQTPQIPWNISHNFSKSLGKIQQNPHQDHMKGLPRTTSRFLGGLQGIFDLQRGGVFGGREGRGKAPVFFGILSFCWCLVMGECYGIKPYKSMGFWGWFSGMRFFSPEFQGIEKREFHM